MKIFWGAKIQKKLRQMSVQSGLDGLSLSDFLYCVLKPLGNVNVQPVECGVFIKCSFVVNAA